MDRQEPFYPYPFPPSLLPFLPPLSLSFLPLHPSIQVTIPELKDAIQQVVGERNDLLSQIEDLKQITEVAKRERVLAIDEKDKLLHRYVNTMSFAQALSFSASLGDFCSVFQTINVKYYHRLSCVYEKYGLS